MTETTMSTPSGGSTAQTRVAVSTVSSRSHGLRAAAPNCSSMPARARCSEAVAAAALSSGTATAAPNCTTMLSCGQTPYHWS
jgi:hypothetical protein